MGLFQKIFSKKSENAANQSQGCFKTLTAYAPSFQSWSGNVYESDLIRSAIHVRATHISKLAVQIQGAAKQKLQTRLRASPNEWQTWGQFLYRLSTILDVHNTAFIVPVLDDYGEPTGIYPVLPTQCEIVSYHGEPWLRYTFVTNEKAAIELKSCGIMTKFQYKDDFFGDSNRALDNTLDLITIQNQGIQEAVKSSASYRFMARVNNFSKPEDLAKERKRFNRENLQKEGGGILLFPNTYSEIKQIESKPYIPDAEQMKMIQTNVYNYFNVNEDILQGKAYGDAWSAFYELVVEGFSIQFSDVVTKMLFSAREQAQGAMVMATANRLQYMSNKDKLAVSSDMADRGIMNRDEIREIWNLPPLPNGQGQQYTIRGEYYLLGADGSVTRKNDDLTGGAK